ncbi:hypothetical protein IWX50DRAFT_165638 [Phyllosticta citricarpa]
MGFSLAPCFCCSTYRCPTGLDSSMGFDGCWETGARDGHARKSKHETMSWLASRGEGKGGAEPTGEATGQNKAAPPPLPPAKAKANQMAGRERKARKGKQAGKQAGRQAGKQHNRKGRVPSLYLPSRQGTRRPFREPQTRAVANVPALTPARHLGPRKGATTARLASRHTCNQWTPAPRPDSSAMLSKALISVNMSLLCTCLPFGLRLRCVALRLHLHALACRRSLSLSPSLSLLFPLSRSPQGSPWPRPQILFLFFFFFFFACAFVWAA